jgi:hypothetical protein
MRHKKTDNLEYSDEGELSGPSSGNDRLMSSVMDVLTRLSREEIGIEDALEEVKEIFSFEI